MKHKRDTLTEGAEVGPRSEVAYWQSRLTLLSHISNKLRCKELSIVISVASTARCKSYNEWKTLDAKLTNAAHEARDTHRCLSRLDEAWAPLYEEVSIEQMSSLLPILLAGIRNVQTICRFYAAPEQLATLMRTVTLQLIVAIRAYMNGPGRLWDQDKPLLIANLCAIARLRDVFVSSFRYMPNSFLILELE
ncbi:g8858 [Coccomyxa viridis]|uniref:G8858 protein n=1 Tax=Coccomyxa viridis TaxID=1274662 RepID=A0ABP1G5J3_9CHLO